MSNSCLQWKESLSFLNSDSMTGIDLESVILARNIKKEDICEASCSSFESHASTFDQLLINLDCLHFPMVIQNKYTMANSVNKLFGGIYCLHFIGQKKREKSKGKAKREAMKSSKGSQARVEPRSLLQCPSHKGPPVKPPGCPMNIILMSN